MSRAAFVLQSCGVWMQSWRSSFPGHQFDKLATRRGSKRCCARKFLRALDCSMNVSSAQRLANMSKFATDETLFFSRSVESWSNDVVRVIFAYPNEYAVGICSLGYQVVWALLSVIPNVWVSRLFTDAMEPLPNQADLVGFSMSWELDYVRLFEQLEFLGCPCRAAERSDSDALVFGGGPVLTANPEPFADFFDLILLGDGEDAVPALVKTFQEIKELPRRKKLMKLSQIPGVYVPSLYEVQYDGPAGPVLKISPMDGSVPSVVQKATFRQRTLATSSVVSPRMAWENIFMIEAVRSCPEMCTFCLASFVTLPFRSAPVDEHLIPAVDRGLTATNRIGILGASVTQHPQFNDLLHALQSDKYNDMRLSFSSVRANTVTEELVRTLVSHGSKSITIAVESGSERLRRIINKKLENDDILAACERAHAGGLTGVKFYGMAGLPGEIESDHDETLNMFARIRGATKSKVKGGERLRLTFGCSTFVPKAHTPMQWFGVRRDAEKSLKMLEKRLSQQGIEFRPESYKWSCVQALISRGDRRVSRVLELARGYGDTLGSFRRAFKELKGQLPPIDHYVFEDWPVDTVLPWSHLRTAVTPENVLSRKENAEALFEAR